jgi:hypothetical protein
MKISLTGPEIFTTAGTHFGLAAVLHYRNKQIKGTECCI